MWIHLSGAFCHCLRKLFSRQLLEIWVQILLLQPLQLLGHSPFPIQDGILALLKSPIFSFASAHNVNELHAHSMRLQQMLVAQSQTITWSRWQYTLIENFEDPAEGTPSVSRSSFVSHAGSWLRLIAPVLEVGVWSQKIQPSFSSSNPHLELWDLQDCSCRKRLAVFGSGHRTAVLYVFDKGKHHLGFRQTYR